MINDNDLSRGDYVKAIIQIRPFKDKMIYTCVKLHKISDFDELTHHIAQVCQIKKEFAHGRIQE